MALLAEVTNTLPSEWRYISEGKSTAVFSYVGDVCPQLSGMVLRAPRCDSPICGTHDENNGMNDFFVEFQHKIMSRLIPSKHLPRVVTAHVDRSWLEALATFHEPCRLLERKQEGYIDVSRKKALLATDLITGTALAVEIKPKWAFLPSPSHLSPASLPIKTRTCRFCMHSHLKLVQGRSACVCYCPLDLFSESRLRVTAAISCLWDDWIRSQGTVNNLRVFMHGKMIKPEDPDAILQAWGGEQSLDEFRNEFIATIVDLLLESPVLSILSRHQRALDVLDIEGISKLLGLSNLESSDQPAAPVTSTLLDPTISDWTEFVERYLTMHDRMDHLHPTPSDLHYYIYAFLLSAILKDCSLILRIKPCETSSPSAPSVSVIDLDPKSVLMLQKWENLDREIVEAYMSVEPKKLCIDEGVA